MKPSDQKIYLASKSPRRRELLRQIGIDFELLMLRDNPERGGPEVSEVPHPGEFPEAYVARIAREKASFATKTMYWRKLPVRPVLAADTTVTIDSRILGKPANPNEAFDMLKSLSGRRHQVWTSVAVQHNDEIWQATQRSEVVFGDLPEALIRAYCSTPEPYDKAGGYAIQGQAALFIREIVGSHSGIMGLPLFETAQLLQQAGIRVL